MMRRISGFAFAALIMGGQASAQTAPFAVSSCDPRIVTFSNIRLSQAVLANGKPLAAGTYDVRITTEHPPPAAGQSATSECWVEFVKTGVVAGREVASVVSTDDIGSVTKGPAPQPNAFRIDALKEGEYLRLWMNSAGMHYIVNMPVAR